MCDSLSPSSLFNSICMCNVACVMMMMMMMMMILLQDALKQCDLDAYVVAYTELISFPSSFVEYEYCQAQTQLAEKVTNIPYCIYQF
jgi:hypothetical protein